MLEILLLKFLPLHIFLHYAFCIKFFCIAYSSVLGQLGILMHWEKMYRISILQYFFLPSVVPFLLERLPLLLTMEILHGMFWCCPQYNVRYHSSKTCCFFSVLSFHFTIHFLRSINSIFMKTTSFSKNLLFLQCTLNNIYLQRCYEKLERVIYLFLGLYHRFET